MTRKPSQFMPEGPITAPEVKAFGDRTGHHFPLETWHLLDWQRGTYGRSRAFGLPTRHGFKIVLPDKPDGTRAYSFFMQGSIDLILRDRDPSSPILLVESPWDMMAALAFGWPSVACGTGGAGNWREEWCGRFRDRKVAVAFNVDVAGAEGSSKVTDCLSRHGVVSGTLRLPVSGDRDRDGKDLEDFLRVESEPLERLQELIGRTTWIEPLTAAPGDASEVVRPEIIVTTDLTPAVDEAEEILRLQNPPVIFQRTGLLVRVLRAGAIEKPGLIRPPESPVISTVPDAHLLELVSHVARWFKESGGDRGKEILPPQAVVQALAARGQWSLPVLKAIVEEPTMRPDGSILDTPGHDPSTGILYEPGRVQFPQVPSAPSRRDALEALRVLAEPFADFPYLTAHDRSAVLATVLAAVARHAIEGPVPATAFLAFDAGSGKGLQADIVSICATGRDAARLVAPQDRDGDEWRKRILALALEGTRIVLIDNLVSGSDVNSPTLAAALTSTTWSDRYLGHSRMVTAPLSPVWMLTGNNLMFSKEMARRILPCRIDPCCEHPEERTGFRHPDLRAHVLAERPRLVTAALTVLSAYVHAGRPSHGRPPRGSFERWDALIRGALIWLGAGDPVGDGGWLRDASDTDTEALQHLLSIWHATFASKPLSAKRAIEEARRRPANIPLLEAMTAFVGCPAEELDGTRLGNRIRQFTGTVESGLRFEKDPTTTGGVTHWRVVTIPTAVSAHGMPDVEKEEP